MSEPYFYEYYRNLRNQIRLLKKMHDDKMVDKISLLNLETNMDITKIINLLDNSEYIYRFTIIPTFKKIDNKQYCVKIVLQVNFSVENNYYYMKIINRDCIHPVDRFMKINIDETEDYKNSKKDIIFSPSYYFGYKCFIDDSTYETRKEIENILQKIKLIKETEKIIELLSIFYYYRKLIRRIDFDDLKNINIRDIENNESKAFDKKIFLSLETELVTFNIYEFFREIIGDFINIYKYEKETTYEKIEYLKIVKECDFPKYKYYETIIKSKNSFYILIYEEETLEININVRYKIYEKETYEKVLQEYRCPGLYRQILNYEAPEIKSYNYEFISNFMIISNIYSGIIK